MNSCVALFLNLNINQYISAKISSMASHSQSVDNQTPISATVKYDDLNPGLVAKVESMSERSHVTIDVVDSGAGSGSGSGTEDNDDGATGRNESGEGESKGWNRSHKSTGGGGDRKTNAPEPLLTEEGNRYVIYPIQHEDVWREYKRQKACFWTAEELDFTQDLKDWERLTYNEKHFIKNVKRGKNQKFRKSKNRKKER